MVAVQKDRERRLVQWGRRSDFDAAGGGGLSGRSGGGGGAGA